MSDHPRQLARDEHDSNRPFELEDGEENISMSGQSEEINGNAVDDLNDVINPVLVAMMADMAVTYGAEPGGAADGGDNLLREDALDVPAEVAERPAPALPLLPTEVERMVDGVANLKRQLQARRVSVPSSSVYNYMIEFVDRHPHVATTRLMFEQQFDRVTQTFARGGVDELLLRMRTEYAIQSEEPTDKGLLKGVVLEFWQPMSIEGALWFCNFDAGMIELSLRSIIIRSVNTEKIDQMMCLGKVGRDGRLSHSFVAGEPVLVDHDQKDKMVAKLSSGEWNLKRATIYNPIVFKNNNRECQGAHLAHLSNNATRPGTRVFLLYGDSRTGKTVWARSLGRTPADVYEAGTSATQFYNGYSGQNVFVQDEIIPEVPRRGNGCTLEMLNRMCSPDPCILNLKYTFAPLRSRIIVLISNRDPLEWSNDHEQLQILLNRVHFLGHWTRDARGVVNRQWEHGPAWALSANLSGVPAVFPPLPGAEGFDPLA